MKLTTQITIAEVEGEIRLSAPFSAKNNNIYRSRGGKFDRSSDAWVFPATPASRSMLDELFGAIDPKYSERFEKAMECVEWRK